MIEPHYLQLLEQDGFVARYWEFVCVYPTCREAYEAVERQHEQAFGKRKYSDYGVFKNILTRWNKKKAEKQ
jgi:hypothetical protein